jgi:pimeloyl-ACP methyl ester carboxylesterase
MIFPSVISENGALKLYYSGRDNSGIWRLSLACTGQACLMPSPSPTPTPVPTLQPTNYPLQPIIIIPGFMASWNKEAILHNKTVNYSDWKLQKFVKEYNGLISTLKNIGYEEGINLFLFTYDWRQSIDKTTDDLNNFLQDKIWNDKPNQKINIVGHSFGGLVGRIFSQKNTNKINKIISVSSPHNGAVQVYKPLEAGEIDRANTFLWLAEKIILVLNKSTIESDRVTFTNKFPAIKDLIPTFNFLKDLSGTEIPNNNLTLKNDFLISYNQNFSDIFPIFTAIYGEKNSNTLAGYVVEPQNILDQLLGNYPDGKPKESYGDLGDDLILSKSSNQDSDSQKFNYDHGEVVYKKEPIKEILNLLNITFNDNQIIEGEKTIISPSIIFLIKSPATMTVKFGDNSYPEDEGIIFIPNAQSGSYNLKVQGTDQGKYEVIVGQIAENNDIWESINGEITNSSASSQIDDYNIIYNSQTASSIFPTPTTTSITIRPENPATTETPVPTSTPQPTSSTLNSTTSSSTTIASSSNEIPMSKLSSPAVLGMSSSKEESISPTLPLTKQSEIKKETIKPTNTRVYIWALILFLTIGGIVYLFRRKYR